MSRLENDDNVGGEELSDKYYYGWKYVLLVIFGVFFVDGLHSDL
jgi:hypothetical protein